MENYVVLAKSGTGSCSTEYREDFSGSYLECKKFISERETDMDEINSDNYYCNGNNYVPAWYRGFIVDADNEEVINSYR